MTKRTKPLALGGLAGSDHNHTRTDGPVMAETVVWAPTRRDELLMRKTVVRTDTRTDGLVMIQTPVRTDARTDGLVMTQTVVPTDTRAVNSHLALFSKMASKRLPYSGDVVTTLFVI